MDAKTREKMMKKYLTKDKKKKKKTNKSNMFEVKDEDPLFLKSKTDKVMVDDHFYEIKNDSKINIKKDQHDTPEKDDLSPPRRRHDTPEKDDLSPPRRRHDTLDDLSPPRRNSNLENENNKKRKETDEDERWGKKEKPIKTIDTASYDLTVYKKDKKLNEELKSQDRWGDPMAHFLNKKSKSKSKSKSKKKKKIYNGPYPQNRFNIPPSIKWDGVDRSTGFEKIYLQKQVEFENKKKDDYMQSVIDI